MILAGGWASGPQTKLLVFDLNYRRTIFAGISLLLMAAHVVLAANSAPPPPKGMVNLSQGKPYTVSPLVSIQSSYGSYETDYYKAGALTDGYIGSSYTFGDSQWQGFLHGRARTKVLDMGQVNTVQQIQERFVHDPSAGIWFPRYVTYALSLNDTDWSVVGTVKSSISLTTTAFKVQTCAVSGFSYEARFVRMTFPVDVWAFADEFQVFGQTGVVDSATVPTITSPTSYPNTYCAPGSPSVGGTKTTVLVYNGYYASDPSIGENTIGELTPYAGCENAAGKITDFMFDGFLFLPYGAAPSGGSYDCSPSNPSVKSDWDYYLDNTFQSADNLGALNTAFGDVKRFLADSSYKAKVEIAIPYPTPAATKFGSINGDSISLAIFANREEVIKLYVDQVMSKWDSASYENLELVGFYWIEEQADYDVDDSETALINYAGTYVRSLGKVLDWIPYYQSPGFDDWDNLGFDAAEMQPNYAFYNFVEPELGEAADGCRKLGMGIEMVLLK